MGWTVDKSTATFGNLGSSAQAKWDSFQNAVHRGIHPATAAKLAGDCNYKMLSGSLSQFQIRLGYCDRATFLVLEATQTLKVLQVGGHT